VKKGAHRSISVAAAFSAMVVVGTARTAVGVPNVAVVVFSIPTPTAAPTRIAPGPDGAMWFTEYDYRANKIGRITFDGQITEFPIPTPYSSPIGITAGPDGNMWFTEASASKIGRITPNGQITEFATPDFAYPLNITAGPDGNLWFTEGSIQKDSIGRITPDGQVTEFHTFGNWVSAPYDITAGPDGHIWFTEPGGHYADWVGEMTTDGVQIGTYYARPIDVCFYEGCWPTGITVGSDGNLWMTDRVSSDVWGLTPDGQYVNRPYPTPFGGGYLTSGPGGDLWLAGYADGATGLSRMALDGRFKEFRPLPPGPPTDVEVGPDGHSLWVTSSSGNAIMRITPSR
jgi:virginiamycin B lyase